MTALLLDTSSLFFRAYHALPPMNTKSGEPTNALYGFSVLLLKLLRERRPSLVAFARDMPQPTFRHVQYVEYKAGRAPMPDPLRPQWRRLDQLLRAFAVPVHGIVGFEADDVLATLSTRLHDDGKITIVSGDRDLFQLIGPEVEVLFLGARGQKPEVVDIAVVQSKYGVTPAQMPSLMALVGESADNLVGVAGIGPKTASKLIGKYGSVGAVLADLANVPGKLQDSLRAAADRVTMNEQLARLRTDVVLAEPLAAPVTTEALAAVRTVFEELEFQSLVGRIDALISRP